MILENEQSIRNCGITYVQLETQKGRTKPRGHTNMFEAGVV